VQKLFNDPSLYNNVNDSVLMLTRMAPRLELILNNLETFSDKSPGTRRTLASAARSSRNAGLKGSPHAPLPSLSPTNHWAQPKY